MARLGPTLGGRDYDVTAFFGRSGLYDAMREGDDGIVPQARPAQGDHTTGLAFVAGILAALRQAERSGTAQTIETSLFETAVWTQASDYATTAMDSAPVSATRPTQYVDAHRQSISLRGWPMGRIQYAGCRPMARLLSGARP